MLDRQSHHSGPRGLQFESTDLNLNICKPPLLIYVSTLLLFPSETSEDKSILMTLPCTFEHQSIVFNTFTTK